VSNYPPGVTDADIDHHFGGHDDDEPEFNEEEEQE